MILLRKQKPKNGAEIYNLLLDAMEKFYRYLYYDVIRYPTLKLAVIESSALSDEVKHWLGWDARKSHELLENFIQNKVEDVVSWLHDKYFRDKVTLSDFIDNCSRYYDEILEERLVQYTIKQFLPLLFNEDLNTTLNTVCEVIAERALNNKILIEARITIQHNTLVEWFPRNARGSLKKWFLTYFKRKAGQVALDLPNLHLNIELRFSKPSEDPNQAPSIFYIQRDTVSIDVESIKNYINTAVAFMEKFLPVFHYEFKASQQNWSGEKEPKSYARNSPHWREIAALISHAFYTTFGALGWKNLPILTNYHQVEEITSKSIVFPQTHLEEENEEGTPSLTTLVSKAPVHIPFIIPLAENVEVGYPPKTVDIVFIVCLIINFFEGEITLYGSIGIKGIIPVYSADYPVYKREGKIIVSDTFSPTEFDTKTFYQKILNLVRKLATEMLRSETIMNKLIAISYITTAVNKIKSVLNEIRSDVTGKTFQSTTKFRFEGKELAVGVSFILDDIQVDKASLWKLKINYMLRELVTIVKSPPITDEDFRTVAPLDYRGVRGADINKGFAIRWDTNKVEATLSDFKFEGGMPPNFLSATLTITGTLIRKQTTVVLPIADSERYLTKQVDWKTFIVETLTPMITDTVSRIFSELGIEHLKYN